VRPDLRRRCQPVEQFARALAECELILGEVEVHMPPETYASWIHVARAEAQQSPSGP
jgi:hypothetical protein